MIHANEELYRFMFWYCGDSKKTTEDAFEQWNRYHSDDEEKEKQYHEFNDKKINAEE